MAAAKTQGTLDWDDLRVLVAVHRAGSFAGASRKLRIDAATVGRRIAALETALGASVFERLRVGLVLTSVGEQALAAAQQMGEVSGRLADALAASEAEVHGVVRISAPESLTSGVLAPALPAFQTRHPRLGFELSSSQQAADLSRRDADLAVRLFRPAQPSLVVRLLGRMGVALYAHRAYVKRRGRASVETLRDQDLLGYDETLLRTPHGRWFAEAAAESRFVLRTNSTPALLAAARAGVGIALLPCFLADPHRELVRVVGPDVVPCPDLWLVAHEARRAIPRIRAALAMLAEHFESLRLTLAGT